MTAAHDDSDIEEIRNGFRITGPSTPVILALLQAAARKLDFQLHIEDEGRRIRCANGGIALKIAEEALRIARSREQS